MSWRNIYSSCGFTLTRFSFKRYITAAAYEHARIQMQSHNSCGLSDSNFVLLANVYRH